VRACIANRECEHAVDAREDAFPPLLVAAQKHFAVRRRAEAVPEALELAAELLESIDLAVVSQPDRAVFVRHRLVAAARHVDDRKTAMAEIRAVVGEPAFVIRTAR